MKTLTQKDLVVLYLSCHKGDCWIPAYQLKGKEVVFKGFIGSEGDRRALDVMKVMKKQGYYEIEGIRYVVEGRRNGKYKEYRIASQKVKPVMQYREIIHSDGTRSMQPYLLAD